MATTMPELTKIANQHYATEIDGFENLEVRKVGKKWVLTGLYVEENDAVNESRGTLEQIKGLLEMMADTDDEDFERRQKEQAELLRQRNAETRKMLRKATKVYRSVGINVNFGI